MRSKGRAKARWAQLCTQKAYASNFWEFTENLFSVSLFLSVLSARQIPSSIFLANLTAVIAMTSCLPIQSGYVPCRLHVLYLMIAQLITLDEFAKKIHKCHSKSSPSPLDGVGYIIFKRYPALWPAILDLVNSCWNSQRVPWIWKKAIIKLIPKPPALVNPSNLSKF